MSMLFQNVPRRIATAIAAYAATLAASGGAALVGFLQAGVGAVSRTLQARLRDEINAADFGVVADGVADDGPALQLAINHAAGRWVTLPPGTVRIATGVTRTTAGWAAGLKLRGAGMRRTTIAVAVSHAVEDRFAFNLDGAGTAQEYALGAKLHDLSVSLVGGSTNACFLRMRGQWHWELKHIECIGLSGDFLQLVNNNSDADGSAYGRIVSCWIKGNRWAINCPNPTTAASAISAIEIEGTHIIQNTAGGIRALGLSWNLRGGSLSYNGGVGFLAPYNALATPLKGLQISLTEFDQNTGYNIDLQAVSGAKIDDTKFVYSAPITSIRIGDGSEGVARDVEIERPFHRPDGESALTAVTLGTNAANVRLVDSFFTTGALVTKVAGNKAALTEYGEGGANAMRGALTKVSQAVDTGVSYTPDMTEGEVHRVVFNGASITINAPINPGNGQTLTINLVNSAAGARVPVFNAVFSHPAPVALAAGQQRSGTFRYVDPTGVGGLWLLEGGWSTDW